MSVSGTAGFGIKAHDLLNNSNNKCGLARLNLGRQHPYLQSQDGASSVKLAI